MRTALKSALLGVLVLAACSHASADGFMAPRIVEIGKSPTMVASPRQEAVLLTDGETVQVVLRTHFRPGPTELAWVVPVPAKPIKIEKGDDAIFTTLEQETAPRFYEEVEHFGFGCGCNASPGAIQLGQELVTVEAVGTAGIFDYTVLSSSDANALDDWLIEHHYYVGPEAPAVFDRYVKAGWHWLAMRVRPEAAAGKATLAPHPITYSYKASKLVYPLVISKLSADASNEILLYVIANQRYACENWPNWTMDAAQIRKQSGQASRTNYEELFKAQTRQAMGRLFVAEYATDWFGVYNFVAGLPGLDEPLVAKMRNGWLTRLRAVMAPSAMDRDVELGPAAYQETVMNDIHLQASADVPGMAMPLAVFGLLWGGVGLTRRRAGWRGLGWRGAGIALIAVACLCFATM